MQTRSPGGQQINAQGQPYSATAQANAQAGYGMRSDEAVGSPAEQFRPPPVGYNPNQGSMQGPNGPLAVAWGQPPMPGIGTSATGMSGQSAGGAYGQTPAAQQYPSGPNGPLAVAWGQPPTPSPNTSVPQGQQQYPMGPNGPLAALWGQQPGQQPGGGMTTINSGFNPAPLFTPQQTAIGAQQIQNQGIQSAFSAGNQYGLPGFSSHSPAVLSRAGAAAGNAMAGAGARAEQLRLGDRLANQQHLLAGQIGRAADFLGQGANAARFDAINRGYSNQAAGGMLGAILAQQGGIQGDLLTGLGDRQWMAGMGLGAQQLGAQNWLQRMQMMNQMMDYRNLYNPQQQPLLSAMQWA